jgi:hypothetical protein
MYLTDSLIQMKDKDNDRDKDKDKDVDTKIFRLNPRNGKTVMIVGVASHYGQCSVGTCDKFIDRRTKTEVCDQHLRNGFEKSRNGRSGIQDR